MTKKTPMIRKLANILSWPSIAVLGWIVSTNALAQFDRSHAVAQVLPSTMVAGQEYNVTIQFKNIGDSSWSGAKGYMLGAQNPTNNQFWGKKRVSLDPDTSVPPGNIATIKFTVKAPSKPGVYNFQWQMFQGARGWFGDKTPNQKVNVISAGAGNNADFVLQEFHGLITVGPPYAVLKIGQNFIVKVIVKNTGTNFWTAGKYKLASQKPANNLTWLIDHVELNPKDKIKPGQFKTFTFNAVAPSEPGIYDFQWQMLQEGAGFFGTPTPLVKITVK